MKAFLALLVLLFLSATILASPSTEEALADEVATALFEEESDSESVNSCAVGWAQNQIGKGYSQQNRYGPSTFDCSGLVYMAYKNCGKTVPTYTGAYP